VQIAQIQIQVQISQIQIQVQIAHIPNSLQVTQIPKSKANGTNPICSKCKWNKSSN
jgi:hypothetical protein